MTLSFIWKNEQIELGKKILKKETQGQLGILDTKTYMYEVQHGYWCNTTQVNTTEYVARNILANARTL